MSIVQIHEVVLGIDDLPRSPSQSGYRATAYAAAEMIARRRGRRVVGEVVYEFHAQDDTCHLRFGAVGDEE